MKLRKFISLLIFTSLSSNIYSMEIEKSNSLTPNYSFIDEINGFFKFAHDTIPLFINIKQQLSETTNKLQLNKISKHSVKLDINCIQQRIEELQNSNDSEETQLTIKNLEDLLKIYEKRISPKKDYIAKIKNEKLELEARFKEIKKEIIQKHSEFEKWRKSKRLPLRKLITTEIITATKKYLGTKNKRNICILCNWLPNGLIKTAIYLLKYPNAPTNKQINSAISYSKRCTPGTISFYKMNEFPYFEYLFELIEPMFDITIRKLYLSNNNLTELPEAISCLENLEKIYLEGNNFSTLPKSITSLKNLKKINLTGSLPLPFMRGINLICIILDLIIQKVKIET